MELLRLDNASKTRFLVAPKAFCKPGLPRLLDTNAGFA
jgi:hypothetical protein